MAIFLNIDISQGSVATCLRCGGIFKYDFITNLIMSVTVKVFFKSRLTFGEVTVGQECQNCFIDSV